MTQLLVQSFPNSNGQKVNQYFVTTQILGTIKVNVTRCPYGWTATYEGDTQQHSFKSEQDAIETLVEYMEENELYHQVK